ncbi:MAG: hypothetical protein ACRDT8_11485 [Micromonosporaceae bacterium]
MSRKAALCVLTLTMSFTVAGCAEDLQFHDNNVINAESFLHQADQAFLAAVEKKPVTLSDQARCYFAVNEEQIQPTVYCGGARTYGSEADQVWWRVSFTPQARGEEVRLTEPTLEDGAPTARPKGPELIRPNGDRPSDESEQLAAPEPEAGEPGMIIADGEGVDIPAPETPGDEGVLRGPTYQIEVSEAGRADAVSRPEGPVGPASGETLFAAQLTLKQGVTPPDQKPLDAQPERDAAPDSRIHETKYALVSGGHRSNVTDDLINRDEVVVAVSAPEHASPRLEVTVDGKTQKLALTDGQRVATNNKRHAAYYRDKTSDKIGKRLSQQQQQVGEFEFTYSVKYTKATLTPYSAKYGWAPKGKAWLMIAYRNRELGEENSQQFDSTQDIAESYALRAPDEPDDPDSDSPSPSPSPSADPDESPEEGSEDMLRQPLRGDVGDKRGVVIFEVPDSFTSGEFISSPTFSFTSSQAAPDTGTVRLPTQTYTVHVGA